MAEGTGIKLSNSMLLALAGILVNVGILIGGYRTLESRVNKVETTVENAQLGVLTERLNNMEKNTDDIKEDIKTIEGLVRELLLRSNPN